MSVPYYNRTFPQRNLSEMLNAATKRTPGVGASAGPSVVSAVPDAWVTIHRADSGDYDARTKARTKEWSLDFTLRTNDLPTLSLHRQNGFTMADNASSADQQSLIPHSNFWVTIPKLQIMDQIITAFGKSANPFLSDEAHADGSATQSTTSGQGTASESASPSSPAGYYPLPGRLSARLAITMPTEFVNARYAMGGTVLALLLPLTMLAPVPWLASFAVREKEVGLLHMQRVGGVTPAVQVLSNLCSGVVVMLALMVLLWVASGILEVSLTGALVPLWSQSSASLLTTMLLSWSIIAACMGSIIASLAPTKTTLTYLGWLLVVANWVGCVVICTSLFGTPTTLFGHADLGATLPTGMVISFLYKILDVCLFNSRRFFCVG